MTLGAKIVSHIRKDHWNPPIFHDRLITEIPHKGFKCISFRETKQLNRLPIARKKSLQNCHIGNLATSQPPRLPRCN